MKMLLFLQAAEILINLTFIHYSLEYVSICLSNFLYPNPVFDFLSTIYFERNRNDDQVWIN